MVINNVTATKHTAVGIQSYCSHCYSNHTVRVITKFNTLIVKRESQIVLLGMKDM